MPRVDPTGSGETPVGKGPVDLQPGTHWTLLSPLAEGLRDASRESEGRKGGMIEQTDQQGGGIRGSTYSNSDSGSETKWAWASVLVSLGLNFLFCKMGS